MPLGLDIRYISHKSKIKSLLQNIHIKIIYFYFNEIYLFKNYK